MKLSISVVDGMRLLERMSWDAVEGKFGQTKRRYTLSRVMAPLAESSQTVASIVFLVMNLELLLAFS